MKATEFSPLTLRAVRNLLKSRLADDAFTGDERRRNPRGPFPGTVQLFVPDAGGEERLLFALSVNLSMNGVGIKADEPLAVGQELMIAIHEPEISFQGNAVVRHCTEIEAGYYLGLEFLYG